MISDNFLIKLYGLSSSTTSIKRFKQLALDLAVSGRLLPQDAKDEHANVTLAKASVGLLPLPGKNPYRNLVGWSKINLGCAIKSNTGGGTPPRNDPSCWNGSIPWASVKDIGKAKHISATEETITQSGLDCCSSNLIPAGRLIVVTRMGLGKLAVNTVPIAINQDLRAIEPTEALDLNFAYLLFKSLKLVGSGVTVKGITVQKLHEIEVGLPPLAEQKRIVAKVDELMALCDRLEAQLKERDVKQAALAKAALAKFTEDPTPENLQLLFHLSFSVPPVSLRKAILTLAFNGKLVPQLPSEEPAVTLLQKTREKKAELIRKGLVKKEPWSHKLQEAEALYALPPGWEWTHISDTVEKVTVGFVGSMKQHYASKGVPFLRSQNVRENRYEPVGLIFISSDFHRNISKSTLRPGDLLVTRSGNVGVTCVVPEDLPEANCSDLVIIKRPLAFIPEFLSFFINSVASGQIEAKTVGIALTHFNTQSVAQMTVALPPLAEQRRIVAKVEYLLGLTATYEAQLEASRTTGEKLLEAMVAELTSA